MYRVTSQEKQLSDMALVVQKFGGTSVGSTDLIRKVALKVKAEVDLGNQVIVVVSAMSGVTNDLVSKIRAVSTTFDRSEYDAIVASGEQVSAGLLSIALNDIGIKSRSWLGWQIPIMTSGIHSQAKIMDIPNENLNESLNAMEVPVIAGFQGISPDGRITTIGRGGSDTTAVAVAAFMKADRCDIYTDVDGVYTADPRYVSKAGRLEHIAYHEMLELATQGAKVLQHESVEMAMRYGVPLRVLSSHTSGKSGTSISGAEYKQSKDISGVVQSPQLSRISLKNVPDHHNNLSLIKDAMDVIKINPDMESREFNSSYGSFDYSFVVPEVERERTCEVLTKIQSTVGFESIIHSDGMSKISVVGGSLGQTPHLLQKFFHEFALNNIKISNISTSDVKISVLIQDNETEKALNMLHTAYGLDIKG